MRKITGWIIEDWTGKRLFPSTSFPSFEDGWSFIYDRFTEEDFEDLYVVPVRE